MKSFVMSINNVLLLNPENCIGGLRNQTADKTGTELEPKASVLVHLTERKHDIRFGRLDRSDHA